MKRHLLLTPLLALSALAAFAGGLIAEDSYRVVVKFGSACCGTDRAAEERLAKMLLEKEQKIGRPLAQKKVHWGKEGEFNLCLPLSELHADAQARFVEQIRALKIAEGKVEENIPCRAKW